MKTKRSGVSEKANARDSGRYADAKTLSGEVSEKAEILPFGIASRGSFKRQIILTFVVGFFLLTVAFAAYQVKTESAYLYRDSTDETMSLAESLAASSRSWVLANDVAGLQEVVHAFQGHPELRYAMIISPAGRVLAHSDATKIGQFVTDEQSLALIKAPLHSRIMIDDGSLIDIAVPIMVDQRHVGWARAGQGREGIVGYLHNMMLSSALFVLMAVILSLFAALLIANRLGYRIGNLMRVAEAVQAGNYATRANISGADEIAKLADSLNQMLDVLVRNEKELRAASLYTRRLIEASLDPLVTISPEGKITDVNRATEAATGRSRSELIATDFSDYFTEPDKAREGYRQVFLKGFVTDYPLVLRHRDGHFTDVLYNASVYRDEAGEVLGVFAAARDVTERKKAEQEVVQLSLRNRLILDSAGEGIYGLDIDGRCTFVNPAALQSLGFGGEELIGQPSHSMFHHTRPDGRSYPQEECPVQAAYKQGAVHRGEDLYWRKDGSSFPVEFISTPIMEAGKITGAVVTFRDITERKRAEIEIARSRQELDAERLLFQAILDNSPLGIWMLGIDNRLRFVNKTFCNAVGISEQQFLSAKYYADVLPPSISANCTRSDRECFEQDTPHLSTELLPFVDGKNHLLEITKVKLFDHEGRVLGLIGLAVDITERKLAEEQLRRSEHSLSEAQRIAHLGNWELDLVSNALTWSDEIYRIFEIDPEKFGASYEAFLNAIHPDDREMVNNAYTESVKSRVPYDIEHRLLMKDGRVKYVNEKCETHYGGDDKPLRSVGTVHDITERKKVEMELRELNNDFVTLLENTGDFIYFKDQDSRFRFCSQTMANVTGHHSWRDMIGKHDLEVFPEDIAHIYHEEELPIFQEGKPLLNKTDPYYDEQGRAGWVNTNKWPVFGDDKQTVVGIFGISRDITELKEAEDKITELNRDLEARVAERTVQLEAANKELEAFSYSVSHDLRSPLRAIDGFSHILQEDYADKLDDEGKRLLNVVRDNTGKMGQLIDDILKFSRAGRVEITFSEIDMEGLAREVYEELQPVAGHGLQMEIGHIPQAMGDRAMLHQVFVNLLSNAIKFSHFRESARVQVGGSIEGNEAVYYVKDNGAGFDNQYVEKLFGVFQRLHSVNEFEGTGIGLAIVKRIITRHGGRVWAEGKVNEGATFYFALPVKAV